MKGRHLFIPLAYGNPFYYASCNIINDDSLLYAYLLHPARGSMLFTLNFDEGTKQYKLRHIVPGLDKMTIGLINENIHGEPVDMPGLYRTNYHFTETGEEYGYFVINRMFVKDGESIRPSEKFHIFYEGWDAFNEYEWDARGFVSAKGDAPGEKEMQLIDAAIKRMNAG